ncbi:TnsA endonuclease N-terminal domain-containing protein [Paraburkholderia bannensis]|uniref:TnsA endonuclease N-terminal domain-containing protein n=1 Tax=Paraburkholderia bannensis TaxID=765414 RepID=UPI002AB7528D|nr:TnsA endonuclease N-terminal domain-containing protein [Paraburkholderia bannensis]
MGRGPRKWTEEIVEQRITEGRGSWLEEPYQPWIEVFDFSSRGKVNRIYSPKLRRTIHLMSDVETNVFLGLEWQERNSGIYEQIRLDRDLTVEIARNLGIKHPCYPRTSVPEVITADFLVTRGDDASVPLEAYDCKMTSDAEEPRTIEKLSITQRYFSGMNIPYHLIFDTEIPLQKIRNIRWIRDGVIKPGEDESYVTLLRDRVLRMAYELKVSTRDDSLSDYCSSFEVRHGLNKGDGLRIARILMYERTLLCDLNNPDLPTCPLPAFMLNSQRGRN